MAPPPPTTPLDFTQLHTEPAPPQTAESSTDGLLQRRRWKQDTHATEDRLTARIAQMKTNTHQTVESSDAALREGLGEVQAKYCEALADFAETYDPRRHGDGVPGNLRRRPTSNWKGSNLPSSSFGASLMQLLTTFSVAFVVSSGVLTMMTSLVTIKLTLRCQLTELN